MNRRVAVIASVAAGLCATAAVIVMRLNPPEREGPVVAPTPTAAPVRTPREPVGARATPEPAPRTTARAVAVAPAPDTPPPPVAEAPPDAGILRIDSDVPGAQVFIDRQFIGAAPVIAENVSPGSHQLNVSADVFHRDVEKARERLRKGDPPATN